MMSYWDKEHIKIFFKSYKLQENNQISYKNQTSDFSSFKKERVETWL